jgi:curved DNA-binding protein
MEYKDYYKIMGLKREASQDEIKNSYRKLARKYHPDVSNENDAEGKFKDLAEAYKVLKDPKTRATYDRLDPNQASWQKDNTQPDQDRSFEYSHHESSDINGQNFSDFFEQLFGQKNQHGSSNYGTQFNSRGADNHAKVNVDIQDAFSGATRSIQLQTQEMDAYGQMQVVNRTLNIKIPKGIKDGQQIRLAGQGTTGIGKGVKGDLYLEVHFNAHPFYQLDQRNLHMQLAVAPWEVALGATVPLPTPNGVVDLKISAGSNSGSKLRLKGRGIPGDPAGDIYVTLSIVTPPTTNEADKALYKEMANTMAFNPRIKMGV